MLSLIQREHHRKIQIKEELYFESLEMLDIGQNI